MKRYEEWNDRKLLIDLRNRFCQCYQNDDGSIFYIEPAFYTTLENFKILYKEHYQKLLDKMDEIVKRNRVVVFTADEDDPLTHTSSEQHAIYLTITDVANMINVIISDNSRGSDYGD